MGGLYYYTAMLAAVLFAVTFQQYLFILLIIAIVMPILAHFHKKGWVKRTFTVVLYNEDMNEIERFEGIKAWEPQQAYYSVRARKKHVFWDTEVPDEKNKGKRSVYRNRA